MGDSSSDDDEQQRAENGGPEDRVTYIHRHNDLWSRGVMTGDVQSLDSYLEHLQRIRDPFKRDKFSDSFMKSVMEQYGHHTAIREGRMTATEATTTMLRNWLNPKVAAFVDANRNFSSSSQFQAQFDNAFQSWQVSPRVASTIKEYYQQNFIDPLIEQRQLDNHHRSFPAPREFARPDEGRASKRQKTSHN